MPPKRRFTKETILDAAFEIARKEGAENINARMVAKKLECSTQPVLYYFSSLEELKREVYIKADDFHTEYIADVTGPMKDILFNIGLRYIRFAVEEKHLFRFLFLSENEERSTLMDEFESEENSPIAEIMKKTLNIDPEKCKQVFFMVFMFAHGYASMLANDTLKYDENTVREQLELSVKGALQAVKEN